MKLSILMVALGLLYFLLHRAQAVRSHFDNTTDQKALLSFKSSIISDRFGVLDSWQPNTSFCLWQGVSCNRIRQRVTGIILKNYSLVGTITSHITNLSFLRILNFEYNSLTGTVPIDIHRLFRLRVLNFNSNNIHGTIPSSLSGCSKLQSIDLSDNHLQGSIPSDLSSLSELLDLNFAKNNLSGVIPSSFGNLSSLNNLILMSNNIEGSIPPELGRLTNFLNLQVALNKISGVIPSQLLNVSSMLNLVLAGNELSGQLPSNLFTAFPNVLIVLVAANRFHGQLPSSLPNASKLVQLDISRNQFSGKVPLFWKLRKIQTLNFEVNQFISEGKDGFDFLTSLTNSTTLKIFSISNNLLTGHLPPTIGNLSSQLSALELGSNKMSGNIPQEVGNLGGLFRLGLAANSFTGKIPSSIGKIKNLQLLTLENNFLSNSIPETLGNLSNLYTLKLRNNTLTGGIPPSLANCQHLQNMDLSSNRLSGNIPKEIFSIKSIGNLNISFNNLNGSLPPEIGKLLMVQELDISNNHLSEAIPSTLGDCSNLRYLDMSANSFQGPIPNSLAKLKGMEQLDISSNTLSGKIPPLDTLKFLQYLNLSYNRLQGEVPRSGIFLNTTVVFLTGNKDLCGGAIELGLPKCIASASHSVWLRKNGKLVGGLVAGAIVVCISIVLCFLLMFRKMNKKQVGRTAAEAISFEGTHRSYSYYELKSATENFSDANLIGRGSFGSVYKGLMRDGTSAAIKVLNLEQHGALKSFLAECEAFRNIRHRNLVKILSACSGSDFKALVLEFMPNGSLDSWLHRRREEGLRDGLKLKQRIEIAIDVASAMEYLHHECETPVVHCDLKPSNVLLDESMTANVGDFGLARMLQNHGNSSNQRQDSSIVLKGSIGYIAPEYGFGVPVSVKGDVYSYGILLLEMFTDKRPTDEMFNKDLNLQRWTTNLLPNMVIEIFYEELQEISNVLQAADHLTALVKIGLKCASDSPDERPAMKDVVVSIKKVHGLLFSNPSSVQISRR